VIDLHTHSTVSDGSDAPERIVELASDAGLTAVALTDHDRLDGIGAARARAAQLGVELVPGCELSCEHAGTMHVLVYFLEPGEGPLQDELVRLQDARERRNERMVARLAELGLPVSADELEAEAGGLGAGRPHIAAILVRKGVVASVQEAFDVWLAKGKPAYMEKDRLAPDVALRLARASGAVPVLAHPLSLGLEPAELERTVAEFADLGLGGIEAIYGRYSAEERAGLAALADRHGLVVSGGSDHHGTYKPDLSVGTGRGDLSVPDEALVQLREAVRA
jgi:predicted metal-dependent phosphoesterase TrpH